MKPKSQEQVGATEHPQLGQQRVGAWLRKCFKWASLTLFWFCWWYGFLGAGIYLITVEKHPTWGALCVAVGLLSLIAGALIIWRRTRSPEWKTDWKQTAKSIAVLAGWLGVLLVGLFVVCFAYAALGAAYDRFNNSGWITHNHDTPVWIEGDWMVGEYRDCQMRTKTVPATDKALDYLDKLPRLFCGEDANGLFDFQRTNGAVPPPPDTAPPEGAMYLYTVTADELEQDFHVMPVRYLGRIDRTDKWVISWRCQRLSMGFLENAALECKAVN